MKKGFTLIEVITVIFILTVLVIVSFTSFKYFKKLNNSIRESQFIGEVNNLLLEGKAYSIKNKVSTELVINNSMKKIALNAESKEKKVVKIPKFIDYISQRNKIKISSEGQLKSDTLVFKNMENEDTYTIKIRIGVDYITIYS